MSQEKTKIIKLTVDEVENFRNIAEKFNVKFEIKEVNNFYYVTAPIDYVIAWGYDE